MTRPGDHLRGFASRVCDEGTMMRVIDPLIADLQWQDADTAGAWRRRVLRIPSYVAFWRVLFVCLWRRGWHAGRGGSSVPVSSVKIVAASAIAASVATALVNARPVYGILGEFDWATRLELLPLLIPSSLVLTLPVGFFVGTVVSIAGRPLRRPGATTIGLLALVLSASSVVLLQWVVPEANHEFRQLASRLLAERDTRVVMPQQRDIGELSLTELRARIADVPEKQQTTFRTFRVKQHYYSMFSFAMAPLVFGSVALGLGLAVSGRWRAIALASSALAGWYFASMGFDPVIWNGVIPAITAAWLPSAVAGLSLVVVAGRKISAVAASAATTTDGR